jgi:hypothetical protein
MTEDEIVEVEDDDYLNDARTDGDPNPFAPF